LNKIKTAAAGEHDLSQTGATDLYLFVSSLRQSAIAGTRYLRAENEKVMAGRKLLSARLQLVMAKKIEGWAELIQ
jgi:hypothetical protein